MRNWGVSLNHRETGISPKHAPALRSGTTLGYLALVLLAAGCAPKFNRKVASLAASVDCSQVQSPGVGLSCPSHVSFDKTSTAGDSNVVITGHANNQIHVLCNPGTSGVATGLCQHVSGGDIVPSGGSAGVNGSIYTLAGSGYPVNSGDGGPAASAGFYRPSATAVDSMGNIVIAVPTYHSIRVVCMAAGGVCAGSSDGLNIDTSGSGIVPGNIYTLAGGQPATNAASSTNLTNYGMSGDGGPVKGAKLSLPSGVAIDSKDNVIIADTNNSRIRVVCFTTGAGVCANPIIAGGGIAGDIYTIAGGGPGGGTGDGLGDGMAATNAILANPKMVSVDSNDNIAIADTMHYMVRVICTTQLGLCAMADNASGQIGTGAAATVGDIYQVAGTGAKDFSSGGVPAVNSSFGSAYGVGFDGYDNLLISDPVNASVSVVCATTSGVCAHVHNSDVEYGYNNNGTAYDIYQLADSGSDSDGYVTAAGYIAASAGTPFVAPTHAIGYSPNGQVIVTDRDNNVVRFMFY